MDIEKLKTINYKKNEKLENLLITLNEALDFSNKYHLDIRKKYPIIFIVGTPRSGTTLLTQWLASLKLFCYPSNFVSRFYKAPFVGALIQEMLVNRDYAYKNELAFDASLSFQSDTGKTSGLTEPHEFWYFWRNFFELPEIPIDNKTFAEKADFVNFQQDIYKFQQVYQKPFFLKSLIMNWYIEAFSQNMENPIFLYIKRDPIANMGSLLQTRERYLGNKDFWFSFKPREYEMLESKDSYTQVAGQVFFTNNTIEKSLDNISGDQQLSISYEDFCLNPSRVYVKLIDLLNKNGYSVEKEYNGPNEFCLPNKKHQNFKREFLNAYKYVQKLT